MRGGGLKWLTSLLVIGVLSISSFFLREWIWFPSFASWSESESENAVVVTWVTNVTQYLTSLVLYVEDPAETWKAVVLKYDWDLNALVVDAAINASALSVWHNSISGVNNTILGWTGNKLIKWTGAVIVWGEWNQITHNFLYWVIVWGKDNKITNWTTYTTVIGSTWSSIYGNYITSLWWGGNVVKGTRVLLAGSNDKVSNYDIVFWNNINASAVSGVFVYSNTGNFSPTSNDAFYVNAEKGFWLNTNNPKMMLDLKQSWIITIVQGSWVNTDNSLVSLWLKCNSYSKWVIAYMVANGSAWLCGCNGIAWAPLSIDPISQYACAEIWTSSKWCTGAVSYSHITKSWSTIAIKRWFQDLNDKSGGRSYPTWTYSWVESLFGWNRECSYLCNKWFHPNVQNPDGRYTGDCIACTPIDNMDDWAILWGTWVDNCWFTCKGGYKYDWQARTCTECRIGSWTPAKNQSGDCSICEAPAKIFLYTSVTSDADTKWWYFWYFLTTWTNANNCDYLCWSWYVYKYTWNTGTSYSYVRWTSSFSVWNYNACASCPKWYRSEWWKNTICKECIQPEELILKYKIDGIENSFRKAYLPTSHGWDENGCKFWACDSSLWLTMDDAGKCYCENQNSHFENNKCVPNTKYVYCTWTVYSWAWKWSDLIQIGWHWSRSNWYWNSTPSWSYKTVTWALQLWTCERSCPTWTYKDDSSKECTPPKPWVCNPTYHRTHQESLSQWTHLCSSTYWYTNFKVLENWWTWECKWQTLPWWIKWETVPCDATKVIKWKCKTNLSKKTLTDDQWTKTIRDWCQTEEYAVDVRNFYDSGKIIWTWWMCPSSQDPEWTYTNATDCYICSSWYVWNSKTRKCVPLYIYPNCWWYAPSDAWNLTTTIHWRTWYQQKFNTWTNEYDTLSLHTTWTLTGNTTFSTSSYTNACLFACKSSWWYEYDSNNRKCIIPIQRKSCWWYIPTWGISYSSWYYVIKWNSTYNRYDTYSYTTYTPVSYSSYLNSYYCSYKCPFGTKEVNWTCKDIVQTVTCQNNVSLSNIRRWTNAQWWYSYIHALDYYGNYPAVKSWTYTSNSRLSTCEYTCIDWYYRDGDSCEKIQAWVCSSTQWQCSSGKVSTSSISNWWKCEWLWTWTSANCCNSWYEWNGSSCIEKCWNDKFKCAISTATNTWYNNNKYEWKCWSTQCYQWEDTCTNGTKYGTNAQCIQAWVCGSSKNSCSVWIVTWTNSIANWYSEWYCKWLNGGSTSSKCISCSWRFTQDGNICREDGDCWSSIATCNSSQNATSVTTGSWWGIWKCKWLNGSTANCWTCNSPYTLKTYDDGSKECILSDSICSSTNFSCIGSYTVAWTGDAWSYYRWKCNGSRWDNKICVSKKYSSSYPWTRACNVTKNNSTTYWTTWKWNGHCVSTWSDTGLDWNGASCSLWAWACQLYTTSNACNNSSLCCSWKVDTVETEEFTQGSVSPECRLTVNWTTIVAPDSFCSWTKPSCQWACSTSYYYSCGSNSISASRSSINWGYSWTCNFQLNWSTAWLSSPECLYCNYWYTSDNNQKKCFWEWKCNSSASWKCVAKSQSSTNSSWEKSCWYTQANCSWLSTDECSASSCCEWSTKELYCSTNYCDNNIKEAEKVRLNCF